MRAIIAGTLVAATALGGPPPAWGDSTHVMPLDPITYDDLNALQPIYGLIDASTQSVDPTVAARCGDAAPDPVPDGVPIVVSLGDAASFTVGQVSPMSWRNPPVADPSWRLNFQGLIWMRPLARRAAEDDQQQSLAALVAQTVGFHTADPDPGTSAYGWDEGTALRRLEAENCLYSLTRAAALVPGMTADAAVLTGRRYYGPPLFQVHNHGLMANLQLVQAGDLLTMPAWKSLGISRMTSEAPLAFSRLGVSFEQSSSYQGVNAMLWDSAAQVLRESPGTAVAALQLSRAVAAAWTVVCWLTEPDGYIVQIGDSDQAAGRGSNLATPRVLRDDQAGLIVGRWSWTDPLTSYYTIRYGPSRRAHGQDDQAGGVTWTTENTRVLVGPGRFVYDKASPWYAYSLGASSHNVAIPDRLVVRSGRPAVVKAGLVQAAAHAWTITDTVYAIAHQRGINVNRDARRLQVSDTFPAAALWRQHWHLDPAWTLASGGVGGTELTFTHSTGRTLTVTTTGRISGIVKGATRPIGGWHYPQFRIRTPASEIIIRSYGRSSRTTFSVT